MADNRNINCTITSQKRETISLRTAQVLKQQSTTTLALKTLGSTSLKDTTGVQWGAAKLKGIIKVVRHDY